MSVQDVLTADPQYSRLSTPEERAKWIEFGEIFRQEPEFLTYIEKEEPQLYAELLAELDGLAIEAQSAHWRTPGLGGRPHQLIPGTPGSFSERTDWRTWILMGGRGSGKSRTGAEAVREFLLGREWHIPTPEVALVGKRLDDVRVTMVQNTLLQVLPPGSVTNWNRASVELTLSNGVYIRGYSSEAPQNLRGPNLVLAWCDELGTFVDADRAPSALDTTMSNLNNALRIDDEGTWRPKLIVTTTPRPVRVLRNPDPSDEENRGPGLYDDPSTVVSNMSTLENIENLSQHFLDNVVAPLEGTRLYDQEILGILQDAALGALWTPELIEEMTDDKLAPEMDAGGLRSIVIGVDPSVDGGRGDECGIVVAGLGWNGRAYVLEDLSCRVPSPQWSQVVKMAAKKWDVDAVVAESNQGGELVTSVLLRDAVNLPVVEVHAKRGKALRAEPVALLSDRGLVRFAGEFPRLTTQMKTWEGNAPGQDSPDRLDAFVYAMLWLLPVDGLSDMVKVKRGRTRR